MKTAYCKNDILQLYMPRHTCFKHIYNSNTSCLMQFPKNGGVSCILFTHVNISAPLRHHFEMCIRCATPNISHPQIKVQQPTIPKNKVGEKRLLRQVQLANSIQKLNTICHCE